MAVGIKRRRVICLSISAFELYPRAGRCQNVIQNFGSIQRGARTRELLRARGHTHEGIALRRKPIVQRSHDLLRPFTQHTRAFLDNEMDVAFLLPWQESAQHNGQAARERFADG